MTVDDVATLLLLPPPSLRPNSALTRLRNLSTNEGASGQELSQGAESKGSPPAPPWCAGLESGIDTGIGRVAGGTVLLRIAGEWCSAAWDRAGDGGGA